jgi:hypothetical protein
LDVFGCVERIVVAIGSEVLREVDRELADLVAIVFDALCECVIVAGLAVSSGVADLDVVGCVSIGCCDIAVAEMGIENGLKRLWRDVAIDEDRDVDVKVAVVWAVAGMRFEDGEACRTAVVKDAAESARD